MHESQLYQCQHGPSCAWRGARIVVVFASGQFLKFGVVVQLPITQLRSGISAGISKRMFDVNDQVWLTYFWL